MKPLLLALLFAKAACAFVTDNLDYGLPGGADQVVERAGYALGYVNAWRQPAWVSYRLTEWEAHGSVRRTDDFREDPEIPAEWRATREDYVGSGYDRGHLSPAADNAWSEQSMRDSFFLSNMSPQKPALNRGLWSRIEAAVRNFAVVEGRVVVVTGPVVTNGSARAAIGANRVLVPDGFYKVVYAEDYGKMVGFVAWQDSKGAVTNFVRSVDDVERLTGLDFFSGLDEQVEARMEAECRPDAWCWDAAAQEDTDEEEWEDYVVDPVDAVAFSGMRRSWGARSWALDLAALTNVYTTAISNKAVWVNGRTVAGLQAFTDGVPVTTLTRNHGAETERGFYAFWATNKVAGAYSFGTMTVKDAGRQVFGVAFRNDLKVDVPSVDVEFVGRQFGFRNKTAQTLGCEILVTNALLAVCNGQGWTAQEDLSFTTPVVGNPDSLAHGKSQPVAEPRSVCRLPVRIRPGEYFHLRWVRDPSVNGAAMGLDGLKVRFSTGGSCVIFR